MRNRSNRTRPLDRLQPVNWPFNRSIAPAQRDAGAAPRLGLATMIAGIIVPFGTYENAGLLVGGWLIVGGLSSAAVMAWQLRSRSERVAN